MTRPKILLYLHHVELGQRYPISESGDVVIGRTTGQLLFAKDERLSGEHCRIFREGDKLMILDLGSTHGTVVDGRLLSPGKTYQIRDGTLIAVGGQAFKCVEPNNRPMKRKPLKKKIQKHDSSFYFYIAIAIVATGLAAVLQFHAPTRNIVKQQVGALWKAARKGEIPRAPASGH